MNQEKRRGGGEGGGGITGGKSVKGEGLQKACPSIFFVKVRDTGIKEEERKMGEGQPCQHP